MDGESSVLYGNPTVPQCIYCGRTNGVLDVDHVIPRCRGGSNDPSNLVPACKRCNSRKNARLPSEWRNDLSQAALDPARAT